VPLTGHVEGNGDPGTNFDETAPTHSHINYW
jgi:hypothetical protein